jgi:hypothetical protein
MSADNYTVTYKGSRSRDDTSGYFKASNGQRFTLDDAIEGVSQETVDELLAADGQRFEIDGQEHGDADGLDKARKEDLQQTASDEGVDTEGLTTNAQLVDAIRASRAQEGAGS